MSAPILATKLYVPLPPPQVVTRPRLIERLNEGRHHKLTLISAPAGFGKTTLVSEWLANHPQPIAWLSLDERDSDLTRFLTYFIAALQTVAIQLGEGPLAALQSPQPPSTESMLTVLLNEVATLTGSILLVLDDYHVLDAQPVDQALTFLLEHLPPQLHLVIATREDPQLPLARYRARGQLTELRAADLRFTPVEAAEFLNQMMKLNLSPEDIAALETRTEGWIAGLQLAALSMQGRADTADLIQSFTGSHHFVLDYLLEEVLHRQPEPIQTFLLHTSILDRVCGPLCDAVVTAAAGQTTLEYLERANLFLIPLDHERHWYRYHQLFSDLLRQRLHQNTASGGQDVAELHLRASRWYETNGLPFEAFRHAISANDIDRAERLISLREMPLHLRSVVNYIVNWLDALPPSVKDARPSLWVKSATLLLVSGQTTGVEAKLQAAETALQRFESDENTRNQTGMIAAAYATIAFTQYQLEATIVQARRALEYLPSENLAFRFTALWALAAAHQMQGDRPTARAVYQEAIAISQVFGDRFSTILATSDLGFIQESDNQLYQAAESYRRVLHLAGNYPQPNIAEAQLGLARIHYQWNDLESAEHYGQQSLQLARQYDLALDRFVISQVFLARLKLARGEVDGAAALIAEARQTVHQRGFAQRMPEVAAVQVLTQLRQGQSAAAAQLAQTHKLPVSQARVHLAQDDPAAALAILEPLRQQLAAKGLADELLQILVLQAVAVSAQGDPKRALSVLNEALALAQPGGFVRLFVDEGQPMAHLLSAAAARAIMPDYINNLLSAFAAEPAKPAGETPGLPGPVSSLIEPLSQREFEVLWLIAEGLSNREIAERLFLSLDTIKGHNRRLFNKLQVQRRTEAVARARELGLL